MNEIQTKVNDSIFENYSNWYRVENVVFVLRCVQNGTIRVNDIQVKDLSWSDVARIMEFCERRKLTFTINNHVKSIHVSMRGRSFLKRHGEK